ncbi:spore germination protein [Microbacteriaceae bacterium 4G12]
MGRNIKTNELEEKLQTLGPSPTERLKDSLRQNLLLLQQATGNSSDVLYKEFYVGKTNKVKAALVYIDGLVDKKIINDVLDLFINSMDQNEIWENGAENISVMLDGLFIPINQTKHMEMFRDVLADLLDGQSILFIDGFAEAIAIDTSGQQHRAIMQPTSQMIVKGPQEAFTELLAINLSLVRKRIKHPNLWTESMEIGKITKTNVVIMYIKGLADEGILQEVRTRLNMIDTDSIFESGNIEEFIEDHKFSMFPTMFNAERPDVVASDLTEGRVAIFVDGTPYVLTVPVVFIQLFQAAEDYYNRGDHGIIRTLRIFSFMVTLVAPAFYIALTTFHQEMLQTTLLISIAAQREAIPFPAFIEALLMQTTFEILREASIRMPRAIGPAVSIVGALVLGEAVVQAGLVSPAMVIVVSITALTTFMAPDFAVSVSQRIVRLSLMILGASFGLFGIVIGLLALLLHLCSMHSFGVPYMAPFGPFNLDAQKDSLLRLPKWMMRKKPIVTQPNGIKTSNETNPSQDEQEQ